MHTRVGRAIEGGSHHAGGFGTPAAGDLDIGALRVELGAAHVVGRVQGEDLVAQDVVAGANRGGDLDGPGAVCRAQLVVRPDARGAATSAEGDAAQLGDLEPLELLLVHRGAVAVARGQVREDGPVVGVGPGGPVEVDGAARGDGRGVYLRVGSVDGADNVGGVDVVAEDGPRVVVPGGPADGPLVGNPRRHRRVVAGVLGAADGPLVNPPVGGRGAGRCEEGAGGEAGLGPHDDGCGGDM